MNKWIFFSGALAVALGAFGAHALRPFLDDKLSHAYETAVQYQFYHTLILAFTILWNNESASSLIKKSQTFFVAGLILFCGSLYAMVLLSLSGFSGTRFLGIITPFGGLSFLAGWGILFYHFMKKINTATKNAESGHAKTRF